MMLADTIEATIRSLPKPTPKRIEDVIEDTIKRKLDDGQFDGCELTLREIHEVGEAIWESVIGFLGPRIEYPADPSQEKNTEKSAKGKIGKNESGGKVPSASPGSQNGNEGKDTDDLPTSDSPSGVSGKSG